MRKAKKSDGSSAQKELFKCQQWELHHVHLISSHLAFPSFVVTSTRCYENIAGGGSRTKQYAFRVMPNDVLKYAALIFQPKLMHNDAFLENEICQRNEWLHVHVTSSFISTHIIPP